LAKAGDFGIIAIFGLWMSNAERPGHNYAKMKIDTHIPSKSLSPYIKAFRIIETNDDLVNRVVPDTSLVMAFRFKGQVSGLQDDVKTAFPSLMVSGLRKSGRQINYAKDSGNVLVIFKEIGANAFIKEPLHELFEDSAPLDSFSGYTNLSPVEEQLAEADNNDQRIAVVERFLISKLYNQQADKLILTALEKIHAERGQIRIKELAKSLYISQDAFEKRFRRVVGVSPKQFAFITRMRSVVNSGRKNQRLTDIAFDAGYFDQPHFNKDFKLFTGQTPKDYFRSSATW
jgi:AraC-like DNA-binding protein